MKDDATNLEGLLILTPTRAGLTFHTEVTLDMLCSHGAEKIRTDGNSDIALHRCEIASQARERIQESPGRYHSILWLDGDMLVTPSTVRQLSRLTLFTALQRPVAPEVQGKPVSEQKVWRLKNGPAISGAYVRRNDPAVYAMASCNPPVTPLKIRMVIDGETLDYELPGVISGMGALCQTALAFLQHCEEAPDIDRADGKTFPAICASGPGKDVNDKVSWGSEDWTYGSWEWQMGRGVYAATTLRFGHVGQTVFWPDERTLFLEKVS